MKFYRMLTHAAVIAALGSLFIAPSPARAQAPDISNAPAISTPDPAKAELFGAGSGLAAARRDRSVAAAPIRFGPFTWRNLRSGKCLDQNYNGGIQHREVIAFTCLDGLNQKWFIDLYDDGNVKLVNARSGKCLDQDYTGNVEHRAVIAFTCLNVTNQKWREINIFRPDGSYCCTRFQNVRSGKFLDQDYTGGVQHPAVIAFQNKPEATNQYWF